MSFTGNFDSFVKAVSEDSHVSYVLLKEQKEVTRIIPEL